MNARTPSPINLSEFTPAQRTAQPVAIGLAGPSGAGKTYSALVLATELAEGGPIAVIDTENGRALQYANRFKFMHAFLRAPFTPEAYLTAMQRAAAAGAKVIVIDSASHEWEGEGGVLDMHEAELERMAGNDWQKRDRVKYTAWIEPKARHGRLVRYIEQAPFHLILCFRAKEKSKMVKNDKGKNEPVPLGWTPICGEHLDYYMLMTLVFPPGAKGRPALAEQSTKLDEGGFSFIKDGQQVTPETGRLILAWSKGDEPGAKGPPPPPKDGGRTPPPPREPAQARQQGTKPPAGQSTSRQPFSEADLDGTELPSEPNRAKVLAGARSIRDTLRAIEQPEQYAAFLEAEKGDEMKKRLDYLQSAHRPLWAALQREKAAAYERQAKVQGSRIVTSKVA